MNLNKLVHVLLTVALACICISCTAAKKKAYAPETREEITPVADNTPAPQAQATFRWPKKPTGTSLSWQHMALPTGDPNTSIVGVEKGMPTQVYLNRPFVYQLVVTNLTQNKLFNVIITEKPCNATNTKDSASKSSAKSKVSPQHWSISELDPQESKTILVKATAMKNKTVNTCTSVTYDPLLFSSIPVVNPQLTLGQRAPRNVLKCEPITYHFDIHNYGSGTAENVAITSPLPKGLVTLEGEDKIHVPVGSLQAGQRKQYDVVVKANKKGSYITQAHATGLDGLSAKSSKFETNVLEPMLEVTGKHTRKLIVGEPLNYKISVKNSGNGEARKTIVNSIISPNAKLVNASHEGQKRGDKMVWDLGTLKAGSEQTIDLWVMPEKTGTFQNQVSVGSDCTQSVTESLTTAVIGIPALHFEVVDVKDPVPMGETGVYKITVTNQGTEADHNVQIVCLLENNQRYESSIGPTEASVKGGKIHFAPIARLEPNERVSYRVVVKNVHAGDVRFKTALTSDSFKRPIEKTEATYIYK